uniref:Exopolysaccharide/PEPCTERM locus tyrosine autokinase n=1 Tax=Nitratidesulfovibrio vulgaris (strain DSM 19637 / Miyazaki F) TaxID=883 RepID=B8DK48_NITV9
MSRIEEALARASRERKADDGSAGAGVASGSSPAVSAPPVGTLRPAPAARAVTLDPKLIAASGFDNPVSEEYRKVKEKLVSLARQKGMNLFMVTSSVMGEGKTLVSANLAISLAQEYDNTVLYIDADLRAPCGHELFGVDASPGLSDCLMDGVPLHDALVPTGVGRLSFLPAGRQLANPGELFASSMMRDMLLEMKRRYADRYIIVDTAPVLPFAETRVLSRMVDGVLLVARENLATISGLGKTQEAIEGANVLGVIYNDASHPAWPSFPGYGNRYGGNRYGYGNHRSGRSGAE